MQPQDPTLSPTAPLPPVPPASPAPVPSPRRPPGRRVLRALAWTVGVLLVLLVALGGAAWWWLGSSQSLAFSLDRAARYMPAGQTLESRDVSGSLRQGGRIGFLRWESPTLAVEVRDATLGWQLRPLLDRQVRLGEVHVGQVLLERRGPVEEKSSEPLAPLEPIVLPVDIELPFRIDSVRWAGPPALEASHLVGSYRYARATTQHALVVDGVDVAAGHYAARVGLQGAAPMALDAAIDGRLRAPLTEGRTLDVIARATAQGALAGADARLAVTAQVRPAEPAADAAMQADLVRAAISQLYDDILTSNNPDVAAMNAIDQLGWASDEILARMARYIKA